MGGDDEDVKMYDPVAIFQHLRFYLDDEPSADEAGIDPPDLSPAAQKQSVSFVLFLGQILYAEHRSRCSL